MAHQNEKTGLLDPQDFEFQESASRHEHDAFEDGATGDNRVAMTVSETPRQPSILSFKC